MRDVWLRIEARLQATAPDLYADLAKAAPATARAIAAAEDRIGLALPEDVRASYAVHDGSGAACILPQSYGPQWMNGVALLSLDEVVHDTQMWRTFRFDESNHRRASPDGPIRRNWWNHRWVPVTWDGGGDHLCLDFDPAPGGVSGQVICFSHETGPVHVVAGSWKSYERIRSAAIGRASDDDTAMEQRVGEARPVARRAGLEPTPLRRGWRYGDLDCCYVRCVGAGCAEGAEQSTGAGSDYEQLVRALAESAGDDSPKAGESGEK